MFQFWTKSSRDVLYFYSLLLLYAIHYKKSIAQMAMDPEWGYIRDRLDPSLQPWTQAQSIQAKLSRVTTDLLTQVRNKCFLKILSFGVVVIPHYYGDNCLIYPTMPYKTLHDLHTSPPPFISLPSFWECKSMQMFHTGLYVLWVFIHVIKLINLYI